MERLGEADCKPIGDCAAPFPPPDATYFVDAGYADGQLDATHFRAIAEALGAAGDGAVVAVEAGTYVENVVVASDITIAGRCAEKVRIEAASNSLPAVAIGSSGALALRGMTVAGGLPGIRLSGGKLEIEDALLEKNFEEGLRAIGGTTTIARSVVRGATPTAPGAQTLGVFVYGGGHLDMSESVLSENVEAGLGMIDAGTEVTVDASIVRATKPQKDGEGGMGVKAFDGSHLTITGSALVENRSINLLVGGPGTVGSVSTTVIRDTVMDERFEGGLAWAVSVRKGASLAIEDSALVRNPVVALSADREGSIVGSRLTIRDGQGLGFHGLGLGATAGPGGSLELHDTALVANLGSAVVVDGGNLFVEDSLMHATAGTAAVPGWPAGRGGSGIVATEAAHADVQRSAITASAEVAAGAVADGTTLGLTEVLMSGTQPNGGALYGHGLVVKDGASATISASYFRANAGTALAFAAATGTVDVSFVQGNQVGIQLQGGSTLRQADPVADPPRPLEVIVSPSTYFWANGVRVGTGEVPLPDPVGDTPQ